MKLHSNMRYPYLLKVVKPREEKGTLNKTTLIFAQHRNKSILSEGDLSETTLKYEITIDGKGV